MKPPVLIVLGLASIAALMFAAKGETKTGESPTTWGSPESGAAVVKVISEALATQDKTQVRSIGTWLARYNWPKTAASCGKYADGKITSAQLLSSVTAEAAEKAAPVPAPKPSIVTPAKPAVTTPTAPSGTTTLDSYCLSVLDYNKPDEMYSYAMTSTSIPCVREIAARLAARGDTRAADVTYRLATLST